MKELEKIRIEAKSGAAFELKKGQLLKVSDPEGEQVAELICYKLSDPDEWLSSGRTLDHNASWMITSGHILYSNRSRPMLSLLEDTCGRNDFMLAPCNQQTPQHDDQQEENGADCHHLLQNSLMGWDIEPDEIFTTFSIFMNVQLKDDNSLEVHPPLSKAGDYVLFRAEMDLLIGLTACAAPQYNNGRLKPIDYEILDQE